MHTLKRSKALDNPACQKKPSQQQLNAERENIG